MFALLISYSFLIPRVYKTIHRPPYEIVKTEDLSSNFLSLQEIQTAYSKFKQLFLIGEKNTEQKLLCHMGKDMPGRSGESWCLFPGFFKVVCRGQGCDVMEPGVWLPLPRFPPHLSPGFPPLPPYCGSDNTATLLFSPSSAYQLPSGEHFGFFL